MKRYDYADVVPSGVPRGNDHLSNKIIKDSLAQNRAFEENLILSQTCERPSRNRSLTIIYDRKGNSKYTTKKTAL